MRTVFQMARVCVGSLKTNLKLSSVNASTRFTPKPQLVTNARSAMPETGTITVTKM
jgi:hypothetical protein